MLENGARNINAQCKRKDVQQSYSSHAHTGVVSIDSVFAYLARIDESECLILNSTEI